MKPSLGIPNNKPLLGMVHCWVYHVTLLLIHLCFAMRIHEPRALPKPQIPATHIIRHGLDVKQYNDAIRGSVRFRLA